MLFSHSSDSTMRWLVGGLTVLGLGLVSSAAEVHHLKVGDGGLTILPNTTTAAPGDTLVFHFFKGRHNVVSGPFMTPCRHDAGNPNTFFSGNMPVEGLEEGPSSFMVTVNDTNPVWIYCSTGPHCELGQVAVVNPPISTEQTLEKYAATAMRAKQKSTDPGVTMNGQMIPFDRMPLPENVKNLKSSSLEAPAPNNMIPVAQKPEGLVFGPSTTTLDIIAQQVMPPTTTDVVPMTTDSAPQSTAEAAVEKAAPIPSNDSSGRLRSTGVISMVTAIAAVVFGTQILIRV